MANIPDNLKYSVEHEWLRVDDDVVRIGITEHAQDQLGDIVYVDLPKAGAKVTAGKPLGVVESVKAASDIFSPVTGIVEETNARLMDEPELVNTDPYGDGWMVTVRLASPAEIGELLDAKAYVKLLAEA